MLIGFKRGQGSIVLRVKIRNSSVSTGAGLTGLTSASSGLIISTIADNEASATAYTVAGSTIETITTLGTYAAPTATKCRFKEVDATNHKGIYEIQIADARYAVSSAKSLLVSISGATNAAECDVVIPLRDLDPYDAVRAGLTALPNANAAANGGLPTGDANAAVKVQAGTGTGQLDFTSGVVKANTTQFGGSAGTFASGIPAVNATQLGGATVTATTSVTIPAAATLATTTGAVGSVTGAVGSVTGNVGGSVASIATGGIAAASFAAGAVDSAALAASAATKVRDTILSDATTFAGASIAAIKAKTDNLPQGVAKNTALSAFEFFMVDSADHVSGKTGLTVTAQRSIDGGAFGACTNSPTEIGSGIYAINLSAADLNGTVITLKFTATGADATVITVKTNL